MDKPPSAASVGLEQFLLLSKNAKGAAAAELIKQATEAPGVYVFGELLDMPNIKELAKGPYAAHYDLLNLFAYGTFSEYKANQAKLPPLSSAQCTKLRHLTVVTLAIRNKRLPYTVLLKELGVSNLRELEDLVIEVIYADIIRGKLDQKHQHLEVDYAIGRDIRPGNIAEITAVLEEWCSGCETILKNLETQVKKANERKEHEIKVVAQIEQEVTNLKKTLKTTHQQDIGEQMIVDSHDAYTSDKHSKKAMYGKGKPMGLRGSSAKK
jgi:COP9 signalosome complex subunit 7